MYFGLQFNKANLARLLAAGGGIVRSFSGGTTGLTPSTPTGGDVVLGGTLALANGGTGATTATAALTNLGVPIFSVLNYGAVADGDGQGNGTDNKPAFAAAIAAAVAAGRGIVWIPNVGTYNVLSGYAFTGSNIEIRIDGRIDITNNANSFVFRLLGSGGTQYNFTAPQGVGSTIISANADAARIVGAPVKMISTTVCNSTDPDPQWRLGYYEPGNECYFGEWGWIKSVAGDGLSFTLNEALQFPGYTTGTVGVGLRACSTVQVPSFCQNVNFTGNGGFISYSTDQNVGKDNIRMCIRLEWAFKCSVGPLSFNATLNPGQIVYMLNCLECRVEKAFIQHSANLNLSTGSNFLHNRYNCIKFSECSSCYIECYEVNGSQGPDDTFDAGAILNYDNTVVTHTWNNLDCSVTSHGASYGHKYVVNDNNSTQAFVSRSRYTDATVNCTGSQWGAGAVNLIGYGSLNANIKGTISGCLYGVYIQRDLTTTFYGPPTWATSITATFNLCGTAIRTEKSGGADQKTTLPSMLSVIGSTFNNCNRVYTGDSFINRVSFLSNVINGLGTATNNSAISFDPSSVEHILLGNVANDLGSTNSLWTQNSGIDTSVFPAASYPTSLIQYDGMHPVGAFLGDVSGAQALAMNTVTANYTLTQWDMASGRGVIANTASNITITLPNFSTNPDSVGVSPFGLWVPIINRGSGTVTLAAGTGATIETPNSKYLVGALSQVFVTKRDRNTWRIWQTGCLNRLPTAKVFGYGTDAGGSVTQDVLPSGKANPVTLNNVCGAITMDNGTLNAGTAVSFTLNNSAIDPTDVMILTHASVGNLGDYSLSYRCGSGSAVIRVLNTTGGNLSEAIVIQFALIKAVAS